MKSRLHIFAVMVLCVFLLSSCIGIKSDIVINNDGSGSIDLAYTISASLDAMGRQDGNVSQPPLPTSKSDFEKTVSRIDGLSLKSYKSEIAGENLLVSVSLEFDSIDALAVFMDESNQTVSFTENNNTKELVFTFNNAPANVGTHEQELFTKALDGYEFEFSLKTNGKMEASLVDQNGNALQNANVGTIEAQNNSVSYNVSMAELLFAKELVILKIVF